MIVAGLFLIGMVLEIIIDFKSSTLFSFLMLTGVPLFLLALSYAGVNHNFLVHVNMIALLTLNQFQLLANPQAFHVLIFWIGLSPLLGAVLLEIRATIVWTIVVLLFIYFNGMHIADLYQSYDVIAYPQRFTFAGLLFTLLIAMVAILFSYTKHLNHKRVFDQNVRLQALAKEVENQNKQLLEQHEEIMTINGKLEEYNQHLEERVLERTEELEIKNRKLTEYAFINSHLLRGPLSRVLGLINLLQMTELSDKEKEILSHLNCAGAELDEVIDKINKAIHAGHSFSRENIRKLKT
jgi:signal transduction histidine kinase